MAMIDTKLNGTARTQTRMLDVRVELVTPAFVASGTPPGVHDLGRFLENLNNPTLSRYVELQDATVRPLYRAGSPVELDAALIVGRSDIIFANFEGPYFTRGVVKLTQTEAPVLLLAPPFQIKGIASFPLGAEPALGIRTAVRGFFVVRGAEVFDAEGNPLGEGEQIIVNSASVQMASATRAHIPAVARKPSLRRVEAEGPARIADEESRAA